MGSCSPVTLSVVIPVYQEGVHLREFLSILQDQLLLTNASYEIILIDDGSTDDTWSVVRQQVKVYSTLRAVQLSRNFGKEAAVCAGLDSARGEAIIVLDADLQHPPNLIPDMVRSWRELNVNIVEAIKAHRGKETLFSTIGSKLFYATLKKLSGFDLKNSSDYKLIDRKVRDAWLKMGERNLFFRGMIAWLGFKHAQVPFVVSNRVGGLSRWTTFSLMKFAVTGLSAFSSLPLGFVNLFGLLFFIFSVVLGTQALYLKLMGQATSGFTTVIILQLMIGGLAMISLGIIGVYIGRIYDEVKGRPRYIISETIDSFENKALYRGEELE